MQQSDTQQPVSKPKRATLAFALSLAGAFVILAQGLVRILRGEVITFLGSDEIRRRILEGLALTIVGTIAIVFAVLIIIGAFFIYNRGNPSHWRRTRLNLFSAKYHSRRRLVNRLNPWRNRRRHLSNKQITKQTKANCVCLEEEKKSANESAN